MTVVREAVEAPGEETTSEDQLVFTERNASGYILRWTNMSATIRTSPERQALMDRLIAASVGKSAVIQTDARGVPVALVNVAEMRSLLVSAMDTMVSAVDAQFADKTPAERDAVRKALAGFGGMYKSMSDQQLSDTVLKDPKMLFGFGGVALTPGRPISFKASTVMPIANTPVGMTETVALGDIKPGELTIVVSSVSNPDDVKAAIATFLEKMMAGVDPSKRDLIKSTIDKLNGFETRDELTLSIDPTSGLPRHAVHKRHVDLEDQSRVEIETFDLVR